MFIVGSLLAKHREQLVGTFRTFNTLAKVLIMILGLLFYTYPYWFLPQSAATHKWILDDWSITIGASVFIISSLGSVRFSKVLLLRPIHFLGKMSYTLYLYHAICLFALFNILYGLIPTWQIYVLVVICSIVVSSLAYYCVELPAIRLTKRIKTNRMTISHDTDRTQLITD